MSRSKEPHYLVREDKGVDYYEVLFANALDARYRGESSTAYMVSRKAVKMIVDLVDDPWFIFLLRNPIDRAWSHYWWLTGRYGAQPLGFREAFLRDMELEPDDPIPVDQGFFHTGLYQKWLQIYADTFGLERIHTIVFEEFVNNPTQTLTGIFEFLNLAPVDVGLPTHQRKNELLKFTTLLRTYSRAGRAGGRFVRHVLPRSMQIKLLRAYQLGDSQLRRTLAAGPAPKIDPATRAWLAPYYISSVESLRRWSGSAFEAWERDFPRLAPPPRIATEEGR